MKEYTCKKCGETFTYVQDYEDMLNKDYEQKQVFDLRKEYCDTCYTAGIENQEL